MRSRLILSFVLIVLVSVLVVVIIARQNSATAVRSFMLRGVMTDSQELVTALEDYYRAHGTWDGVESLLGMQGRGRGRGQGNSQSGQGMMPGMGGMMGQRLRLADASGTVLMDTRAQNSSGNLNRAEISDSFVLRVDGKTVGYLLVEGGMGYNQAEERLLVNRLTQAAVTAGLIAGGLSLLLALLLTYTLMRPVRELTQAARHLGAGDLSQRVKVRGKDELTILANAFNHMADSLQQAQESRRALTADIAHELRNPLAVQRASLEALQDGVYPLTPQALEPVLEQNLVLTSLVEDLRTLALADTGQLNLERTPTDLVALVERVVECFKPQAAIHEVTLEVEDTVSDSAQRLIKLDPLRVDQILSNLLSNALRFAPQGGHIVAAIRSAGRNLEVSVRDSGPGITPQALPHVFDRFYRADRSRSRSEGGTGLGLAIARQLAEAHGGTLTAANAPQGGALFTLSLPLDA